VSPQSIDLTDEENKKFYVQGPGWGVGRYIYIYDIYPPIPPSRRSQRCIIYTTNYYL
jgi:hypothetical protein